MFLYFVSLIVWSHQRKHGIHRPVEVDDGLFKQNIDGLDNIPLQ